MSKKTRVFKMTLSLKGCDKIFAEGFGPGEVASQTLTFEATDKELKSPMFLAAMIDRQDEFIETTFNWKIEQLDDK